ncbi:hypothetical protein I7I51_05645 [Histoplasma capsulatum]|uniref:Uncharacterized protein n=1 Tax=Ajellomyces capsulatus TaxID=5037 RepID=A0A8A1M6C1_AJECA|nr:hypothetical protein I7I51_05645 [Histoplasma capsulatum]
MAVGAFGDAAGLSNYDSRSGDTAHWKNSSDNNGGKVTPGHSTSRVTCVAAGIHVDREVPGTWLHFRFLRGIPGTARRWAGLAGWTGESAAGRVSLQRGI